MNRAEKIAPAAASCGAPVADEIDAMNKIAPPSVSIPRVPKEKAITSEAQIGKAKSFRGGGSVPIMWFTDSWIRKKCDWDKYGGILPATRHRHALSV